MAYSEVGIVNLGLIKIGVKPISALTENSVPAIRANAVWEYIRNEVLEARDWKFAKTRYELAKNATTPLYGYDYAYTLPADFLRLCLNKKEESPVYPIGPFTQFTETELITYSHGYRYVIEALPASGALCLLTDFDNDVESLYINYIRKETNPGRYTAHFCACLGFRIGAELSLSLTEDKKKFGGMMELYEGALRRADALTQSYDYIDDETGSTDWERAGRS